MIARGQGVRAQAGRLAGAGPAIAKPRRPVYKTDLAGSPYVGG